MCSFQKYPYSSHGWQFVWYRLPPRAPYLMNFRKWEATIILLGIQTCPPWGYGYFLKLHNAVFYYF